MNNVVILKKDKLLTYSLYLLFSFTFLKGASLSFIDQVGNIGLYLISGMFFMIFVVTLKELHIFSGTNSKITLFFFVFEIILLFNNFNSFYSRGLINIFEVFIAYCIFMVIKNTNILTSKGFIIYLLSFFKVVLLITYIILFLGFPNFIGFQSFYFTTDYFGELMALYSLISFCYYKFSGIKKFKKYAFAFFPLTVLSVSRTWIMIMIIIFIFYRISPLLRKNFTMWITVFLLLVFIIYRFINVYTFMATSAEGQLLNNISISLFNKQFFSGRNIIWSNTFDLINSSPIFGLGTGSLYGDFFSDTRSVHNYYLQLVVQNGLIGLLFLCTLLTYIWSLFYKKNSDIVNFSAACFIGIIISNVFEVNLLQNQMNFVILIWIIIGLGCQMIISENRRKIR